MAWKKSVPLRLDVWVSHFMAANPENIPIKPPFRYANEVKRGKVGAVEDTANRLSSGDSSKTLKEVG